MSCRVKLFFLACFTGVCSLGAPMPLTNSGPAVARLRCRRRLRPSPRNAAPVGDKMLGAAQGQRENGKGRIGSALGREDAGPGNVEIGYLMGLTITGDDGALCARTHD